MWFLPAFFIGIVSVEILFYLIRNYDYRRKIVFIVFIFLLSFFIAINMPKTEIGYPFCIDVAFIIIFFILFGFLAKNVINYLINQNIWILIILLLILICGSLLYSFNNSVAYVLVAKANYGNWLLFLLSSIIGIFMVLIASIILDKILYVKIKNIITYIGKNTLIIFACQKFILGLTTQLLTKFNICLPALLIILIYISITLFFSLFLVKFSNALLPQLNGNS